MTADAVDSEHSVLVVDDEDAFAESVAIWLRERWDVEVATSGEEALDAYGPHVDAVLLDRRMPSLPGDEVLEGIRDRPGEVGRCDDDGGAAGLGRRGDGVRPLREEAGDAGGSPGDRTDARDGGGVRARTPCVVRAE